MQALSFGETIGAARRKAEFGMHTVLPFGGHALSFRIAVPRDWKVLPPGPPNPELALGAAIAKSDSLNIAAFIARQEHEVNLRDWLEYRCHQRRIAIGELQSGETGYGQMIHASGSDRDGGRFRMTVCGDGPGLVWLVGRHAAGAPPGSEEVLGLAAASFQFVHHSGARTREPLRLFADAAGLFQVSYPQSWTAEVNQLLLPDKSGADFGVTVDGEMIAYMRVEGDRRHPLDQAGLRKVFEIAVEQVEESGIRIQKLDPIPPGKGGGEKERWAGECKLKSGPGQIALLFRRGAGSWLAATMISPAKEINPFAWMRAKRFYEIVTASLRPAA